MAPSGARILDHLPGVSSLVFATFTCQPGRLAMPDVACDLIWDGEALFVVGPMSRGRVVELAGQSMSLTTLAASDAGRLFRTPLEALTDQIIPIGDLAPRLANPLSDLFAQGEAGLLVGRARPPPEGDPRLSLAARALAKGLEPARAAELVEMSARHFRRAFRQAYGLSPGQFGRILRYRRAIEQARAGESLAMTAYRAGYADQPHFNRESHALTGLTPREAMRRLGPEAETLAGARLNDHNDPAVADPAHGRNVQDAPPARSPD